MNEIDADYEAWLDLQIENDTAQQEAWAAECDAAGELSLDPDYIAELDAAAGDEPAPELDPDPIPF